MSEPSIPVANTSPPASRTRYLVIAWLSLAAMIAYICRNSVGVAEEAIREDLGLDEKQMGMVFSAFFLSYALLQIPTGWLGDRWGSRRALSVFSIGWSLATAAMALAGGLPLLLATRFTSGGCQAGLFPASAGSVSRWFPNSERGLANGSLGSFMSLGAALSTILTGFLLALVDWRTLFVLFSIPGILWAIGFRLWFRDSPERHPRVNDSELKLIRHGLGLTAEPSGAKSETVDRETSTVATTPTPWLAMLSSPAMWCICGQQFFRAAGYAFLMSWFPTYLKKVHGIDTTESGILASLPLFMIVVGALLGGAFSDWVYRRTGSLRIARQGLSVASLMITSLLIFGAYFVDDVRLAVTLICSGMFVFSVCGPSAYSITMDMGGRHVATVFSTMNMCGNFGAVAFPMVVPWFREWTGSWETVLLLFDSMFLIAAFCWLMLRPGGTIFEQGLLGAREKS